MKATRFEVEVQPVIPEKLEGIVELANDLLYSWDRGVRGLFYRLDTALWESCNHNPKVFLRRVPQQVIDEAAEDHDFMEEYFRVMAGFNNYHNMVVHSDVKKHLSPKDDLVAYFCAEFGFHESFPIYSGGLGILAGDYCKAASDMRVPFVAIGLLYRQGYFTQTIDGHGNQLSHYHSIDFNDLLITPAVDSAGNEVRVKVNISLEVVTLKIWQAKAGHITLYLLDSDLPENSETSRSITFQLYGGDTSTRIQQEIVLGIGGVRALRAMGIYPTVWHINEGHSAFQILERCREHVLKGLDFDSAMELVAAGTVFTTHTPVAAGHDIFEKELIALHFEDFTDELDITLEKFNTLGSTPHNHGEFNMTSLALRGSRFHNGVSRIHGGVASQMEGYIWPQVPHDENPLEYVTNGVHVPTFLAREWANLFDMRFREWRNELLKPDYWDCIDTIPDHRFWSLRQELKTQMLEYVGQRTFSRYRRSGYSEAIIERVAYYTTHPEDNVLILGFARRFATYKRAALLFSDPERLARLLNDKKRPVMIIYAGKAHPNDVPGQQLIRTIHEYSLQPEFIGKILLLEGYDMALARKLVTGVDVWLNTPAFPLEASGTSGQKAAINGVINLSVLDGWWGEAYNLENGWAIHPHAPDFDHAQRDKEEAHDLYTLLEHEIVPTFFDCGSHGYSGDWVKISKESMKSCIPRFNAHRMVDDYVSKFYGSAKKQRARLIADGCAPARELAGWKSKISQHWSGISIKRVDEVRQYIKSGEKLPVYVSARLNGLSPNDVAVECIVGTETDSGEFIVHEQRLLNYTAEKDGEHIFELDLAPSMPGLNSYKVRIYPHHDLLSHRFETGYMVWL